jgi:hypothetical protein
MVVEVPCLYVLQCPYKNRRSALWGRCQQDARRGERRFWKHAESSGKDSANGTGVDDCNRYCSTYYKAVRVGGGPGIHTHTHTHTHTQNNPALLCNPLWSMARALASRRTRLLFFQTVYSFKQLKRISLCTERRRRNYFERHGGGNIGKPI